MRSRRPAERLVQNAVATRGGAGRRNRRGGRSPRRRRRLPARRPGADRGWPRSARWCRARPVAGADHGDVGVRDEEGAASAARARAGAARPPPAGGGRARGASAARPSRADGHELAARRVADEGVVDGEPGGAAGRDDAGLAAMGAPSSGRNATRARPLLALRTATATAPWPATSGAPSTVQGELRVGHVGGPADVAREGVDAVEARDAVGAAGDDEERVVRDGGRRAEAQAVAHAPDDGAGHDVERGEGAVAAGDVEQPPGALHAGARGARGGAARLGGRGAPATSASGARRSSGRWRPGGARPR